MPSAPCTCIVVFKQSTGIRKTRKAAAPADAETVLAHVGIPSAPGSVAHSSIMPALAAVSPAIAGAARHDAWYAREVSCGPEHVTGRQGSHGAGRRTKARERALNERWRDSAVEAADATLRVQELERLDGGHPFSVLEVHRRAHPPARAPAQRDHSGAGAAERRRRT